MALPLSGLFLLLALGSAVAIAVAAYQLAEQMGIGSPLAWAGVHKCFCPASMSIALLVLSSKAQVWCQRYGIKVGLLGPTREVSRIYGGE